MVSRASHSRRRRYLTLAIAAGAVVGALSIWLYLGKRDYEAGVAAARGRLAERLTAFAEQRWVRPPPHGQPKPGNAAEAQLRALDDIPTSDVPPYEALSPTVLDDGVPSTVERFVDTHSASIRRARDSVQREYAWVEHPPRSYHKKKGEYLQTLARRDRLRRSLLVAGYGEEASKCLTNATEVLRMIHDSLPGDGLEAAKHAWATTPLLAEVITRCALRADPALIRRQRKGLARTATSAPPIGLSLQWEALFDATVYLGAAEDPNTPWLVRVTRGPDAFRTAVEDALRVAKPLRDVGEGSSYPAAVARIEAIWADISSSRESLYKEDGKLKYFVDASMRTEALSRGLVLALDGIAAWFETGVFPRSIESLSEESLKDPFSPSGAPLQWDVAAARGSNQEATRLRISSVGRNGRDDQGEDDDVAIVLSPDPGHPDVARVSIPCPPDSERAECYRKAVAIRSR